MKLDYSNVWLRLHTFSPVKERRFCFLVKPNPILKTEKIILFSHPRSSISGFTSLQNLAINTYGNGFSNLEPRVGMEFDSEDAAKEFYDEYARRAGFVMRIDQCRRSEVDKRILSRRLSCNKQGYYVKMRDHFGPVRKSRSSTREGCKAMMLVKVSKSGKWIVTRFEKDHTHPLVVSGRPSRNAMDGKDRRIQELTLELEHQDRLCDLYREQLITFLKNIDEQNEVLSTKIEVVVNSVREFETDLQKPSNLR